jgi:UDP-N-acetyl-D-glucosamine dehydrogenase
VPCQVLAAVTTALNGQKVALNSARIMLLVWRTNNIDDLRESPALTIIELLQKKDVPR